MLTPFVLWSRQSATHNKKDGIRTMSCRRWCGTADAARNGETPDIPSTMAGNPSAASASRRQIAPCSGSHSKARACARRVCVHAAPAWVAAACPKGPESGTTDTRNAPITVWPNRTTPLPGQGVQVCCVPLPPAFAGHDTEISRLLLRMRLKRIPTSRIGRALRF